MSYGFKVLREDGEIIISSDETAAVFLVIDYFDLDFSASTSRDYSATTGVFGAGGLSAMEIGNSGFHTLSFSGSTLTATANKGTGTGYIVVGYS